MLSWHTIIPFSSFSWVSLVPHCFSSIVTVTSSDRSMMENCTIILSMSSMDGWARHFLYPWYNRWPKHPRKPHFVHGEKKGTCTNSTPDSRRLWSWLVLLTYGLCYCSHTNCAYSKDKLSGMNILFFIFFICFYFYFILFFWDS